VESFGYGVRRAKEAGFDGIMIHSGTGYLPAQFLSPLINKRPDEYGINNKMGAEFLLELVDVSINYAGTDYPIIVRMSGDQKVDGGYGVAAAILVCKMLQQSGVSAIDVTVGSSWSPELNMPSMYKAPGCNADVSEAIKKEIEIPVSVAGKINDPYVAEMILSHNQLISFLWADHCWLTLSCLRRQWRVK